MTQVPARSTPARAVEELSPGARAVRAFVVGNYFYVLSALLMMVGCYALIKSPAVSGTVFVKTLKAFLVLQGYELLVIATAVWIVRRFARLGDAFTLLVIELALLLDPTFFSNAFLTMISALGLTVEALTVCGAALVFALAKLLVLQPMLKFRLSARTFAAFLAAAVIVYFGTLPLNLDLVRDARAPYFYVLGWAPLLVAMLSPPKDVLRIASSDPEFATERQLAFLPRFVIALPLVIVALHYLESSPVYGIRFYWLYGTPLLLTLAFLALRAGIEKGRLHPALALTDALALISVLVSIGPLNAGGKAMMLDTQPVPGFIETNVPVMVCGAVAALFFAYAYARTRDAAALGHLVLVVVAGLVYGTAKLGTFAWVGNAVVALFKTHLAFLWILLWVVLLALSVRFRKFAMWFVFATYSIVYAFGFLPNPGDFIFEILQCLFAVLLVLFHIFGDPKKQRYAAALFMAVLGVGRFLHDPVLWKLLVVGIEAVALVSAGLMLREAAYVVVGLLQVGFVAPRAIRRSWATLPAGILPILGGLVLFACGVLLTLKKQRVLRWLEPTALLGAAGPPDSAPQYPRAEKIDDVLPPASAAVEEPEHDEWRTESEASDSLRAGTRALLRTIFIHDTNEGVILTDAESRHAPPGFALGSDRFPAETVEVVLPALYGLPKAGVLLTDLRLILRDAKKPEKGIHYQQIASVARHLASVIVTGHAGQVLVYEGLSTKQSMYLKRGLEKLLAELAVEPPAQH